MGIFHQCDERQFLLEVIMTDRFSNFADLAEHYAREVATPDYARAFMEQTELAKLSIEHEPSSIEMPDPDTAQAAIEMMLATVFDLFRDTRMEDFAREVAWGIANSFHVVAKRLDDREDAMANRLQEKLREYDPSEVYATDLEDITMQARSLAECRDAMECMRDHAARIYLVETGRPFSPVRGSRVSSKTNASMIEARDYLAAQKAQRREQLRTADKSRSTPFAKELTRLPLAVVSHSPSLAADFARIMDWNSPIAWRAATRSGTWSSITANEPTRRYRTARKKFVGSIRHCHTRTGAPRSAAKRICRQ
jgi:hypothetical protein